MLEATMNSPAIARLPGRRRLALIVAGVLALLGSFAIIAPAQAGYYGDAYYGPRPCSYRCGGYAPRYYNGCSSCGCYRRCGYSRGGVYERRYIEREYIERRYGYGGYGGYRRNCGYSPCGGYRPYYGYSGGYRPFPYGYGGVRYWRSPYGYRYEPSVYEEAPRPLAPVGYEEAGPDGYEAAY
jgi:hypothetical protein